MKVYKICDEKTGLFSTGGANPKWTKVGKIWQCEGHVKSSITNWATCYGNQLYNQKTKQWYGVNKKIPKSWKVICFDLNTAIQETLSAEALHKRPAKK